MDINYNGWKDEEHYEMRAQLTFEAERELLKLVDMGDMNFIYVGDVFVGATEKTHEVRLRLYKDATHSILITKDRKLIANIFFKDLEACDS